MNTHDIEQQRAAFEAGWKVNAIEPEDAEHQTYLASCMEADWKEYQAAIEDDRKRRGEPAAWIKYSEGRCRLSGQEVSIRDTFFDLEYAKRLVNHDTEQRGLTVRIVPVFEHPHPAEPVNSACPTDVCLAAQAEGVLCANDECDRESSVRPAEPVNVPSDFPLGAIENGRVFADRVETAGFECAAGDIRMCADWQEFRRCFEYLAEWATRQAAQREF